MPRDSVYGEWPNSGEIDIVESKGNAVKSRKDQNSNLIRSSLHWGPAASLDRYTKTTNTLFRELSAPPLVADASSPLTVVFSFTRFHRNSQLLQREVQRLRPRGEPRLPRRASAELTFCSRTSSVGYQGHLDLAHLARSLHLRPQLRQVLLVLWQLWNLRRQRRVVPQPVDQRHRAQRRTLRSGVLPHPQRRRR